MFGHLVLSVDVFIALNLVSLALPRIKPFVDIALFVHIINHLEVRTMT